VPAKINICWSFIVKFIEISEKIVKYSLINKTASSNSRGFPWGWLLRFVHIAEPSLLIILISKESHS
jgi:hypothetical protein